MWYCKLLPRVQTVLFPASSKAVNVFGSMLLDQLAFAPILLSGFFTLNQIVVDRDIKSFDKGVKAFK